MTVPGSPEELWSAALPVIELLEGLGIEFHVGGSLASGFAGVARTTQDVDLVLAGLSPAQAVIMARGLEGSFYVSLESIRDASRRRGSFNVMHLETMTKIDIFLHGNSAFDRSVMRRRTPIHVEALGRTVDFASAEDIVLRKLVWFDAGNRMSDRQWYDLVGVLKVQGPKTDVGYLRHWARDQGVEELLERALAEAGLSAEPAVD